MKFAICIVLTAFLAFSPPFLSNFCEAKENKYDAISQKYGFTLEEEREIGFQSAISLIKKYGHYKNKPVNNYINSIGNNIVSKVSIRPDINYRFIVLDTDEVNAFAAPGGFVFITRGAVKIIDNEAELASVLAHEITHVEEGHGLEAIASNQELKETILSIKSAVDSGQGLSQNFEEYLEKELNSDSQNSKFINVENLKKKL
ncbi:MAG: hypothetical protein A2Y25_05885 [Candidatus Melainabacteria bacterium GWF2_37_15]|nr:MAG: hypothetical protein A2Y25_05885 [Candidatus Melainabacteria bacterium GWF2_37_15]